MRRLITLVISLVISLGLVSFALVLPQQCVAEPLEVAKLDRDTPVDFQSELLPVLRKKCLACHNATDAEGDVILESPQVIANGGSSGPIVVPGDAQASMLMTLAAHRDEPIMPPEDNEADAANFTSQELALLELWINQGATGEVNVAQKIEWQTLPTGLNPIYAVRQSRDGRYLVAGRANQIWVYDTVFKTYVGTLADPGLQSTPMAQRGPVAHLDLVQSIAVSPNADAIASGGYRTVKIWRQVESAPQTTELNIDATAAQFHRGALFAVVEGGKLVRRSSNKVEELPIEAPVSTFAAHEELLAITSGKRLIVTDLAGTSHASVEASDEIRAVAWTTTGPIIGVKDGSIQAFILAADKKTISATDVKYEALPSEVAAIAVSKDQFAIGDLSGTVRIYQLGNGKPLQQLKHPASVTQILFDGNRVVTLGGDQAARLWNAKDAKLIGELNGDFDSQWQRQQADLATQIAKRHVDNINADFEAAQKRTKTEEENLKKTKAAKEKAQTEFDTAQEAAKKSAAEKMMAAKQVEAATEKVKSAEATVAEAADEEAKKNAAAELKAAQDELKKAKETLAKKEKEAADKDKAANEKKQTLESSERSVAAAERTLADAKANATKIEPQVKLLQDAHAAAKKHQAETDKQFAEANSIADRGTLHNASQLVFIAQRTGRVSAFHLETGDIACSAGSDEQETIVKASDAEAGTVARVLTLHVEGTQAHSLTSTGSLRETPLSSTWALERVIGSATDSPFSDRVTALAFQHDAKKLAVGGGEPSRAGELKIVELASGDVAQEIKDAHSDTVFGLAFSPDGKQLASCGADRFMKVFELATGERVRTYEGHTHHVLSVAWRADGRVLATGGADKVVKVWNAVDGSQLKTIQGFGKEVVALQFAASSDNFYAACGDQNLYRCDVGGKRKSVGRGTDFLYAVSITAAGNKIAFAGHDSVVRIVDGDGKLLLELKPETK